MELLKSLIQPASFQVGGGILLSMSALQMLSFLFPALGQASSA